MTNRAGSFTPKLFTVIREGYGRAGFRADAIAGLTVAFVALPLAMALGVASGASPDKGWAALAPRLPAFLILEFVPYLDASGAAAIAKFVARANAGGTEVVLAGVQSQPFRSFKRHGLGRSSRSVRYAPDFATALARLSSAAPG